VDLRETNPASQRRHPWETARLRFLRGQLLARGLLTPGAVVVDVGAGDGFFARHLVAEVAPAGQVFAYDLHYTDDHLRRLAGDPAAAGVVFTRTRPPVRADLVLLLDVLEHVAEDRALLASLVREVVKPGGHVLISVPAWDRLYTRHDAILGHCRRYSPVELRRLVTDSGLVLVGGGGLFHSLLPLRGVRCLLAGRFVVPPGGRRGENPEVMAETGLATWRAGALVTALVDSVLRLDNGLSHWSSRAGLWVPGLSLWALAKAGRG
jgi:SAM-dependent methyltransferase